MPLRVRRLFQLGLLVRFSLVGVTVGIFAAGGMAWFIQGHISDMLLDRLASRTVESVNQLSRSGALVVDDFVAPHSPAQLASLATRLDPVFADLQVKTSIIRLQIFAEDGTMVYSDLPSKRGRQVDLDVEDELRDALRGQVMREISDLTEQENSELKPLFDQALEVYVPVELNGQVVGAYEVYQDMGSISSIGPLVWEAVLGGFVLLFAALLAVVYTAAVHMRGQQQRLLHSALHDALTDLPNRALFLDRLGHTLARRRSEPVAVLFVKIDGRQLVKDSLGHSAADQLLVGSAVRVCGGVSTTDTVARVGDDELSVLLEDVRGIAGAIECAEGLLAALSAPLIIDGHEVYPSANIGIALDRGEAGSTEALLRDASTAMNRAAASGKDTYAVFEGSMAARASDRLALESDMRRALERAEFRLHYQPILSLRDRRMVGVEALVRWQHPERGLVGPVDFIPVAEETGLIVPLGQWVLEEACRQAAEWHSSFGAAAPLVNVNLSALQFQRKELLRDIRRALTAAQLAPWRLKVEITESVLMADAESTLHTLCALKALGVRLAIDDFGTGYSSLAYLKKFPVDTLKLDRSFVAGLGEDGQDTAIVASVVALARALDLSVTAEGIETDAQHAYLRELGCAMGQGFLFARAVPPAEIDELLGPPDELRLAV